MLQLRYLAGKCINLTGYFQWNDSLELERHGLKKKFPTHLNIAHCWIRGYVCVASEINLIVQWNNKIQKQRKACVLPSVTIRFPALHKLERSERVLSFTAEPWWDSHQPEKPLFLAWVVLQGKRLVALEDFITFFSSSLHSQASVFLAALHADKLGYSD